MEYFVWRKEGKSKLARLFSYGRVWRTQKGESFPGFECVHQFLEGFFPKMWSLRLMVQEGFNFVTAIRITLTSFGEF